MRLLIITNLFPNSQEPTRGIFNFQQFDALRKLPGVEIKVIAPAPWFPRLKVKTEKWQRFSHVPKKENISGFEVYHPKYIIIPGMFRSLHGVSFFFGIINTVKNIQRHFKFDCILATWAYPDGFASALVAKALRKPLVIKVHGSDINSYIKFFIRRKMITYAFSASEKIITVTESLKKIVTDLGIPANKIIVVKNGVDTDLFKPMDMGECRKRLGLGLKEKIIIFVGNLAPVKGVNYLLEAMALLSKDKKTASLIILGDGEQKDFLQEKAKSLRLEDIVAFRGRKPHADIPLWLNASDIFCLPSLSEGCPNVVLEALACGKQVVATDVGCIPEVITSSQHGVLVPPKDSKALSHALKKALDKKGNGSIIGQSNDSNSWGDVARKFYSLCEYTVNNCHCERPKGAKQSHLEIASG